MKRFYGFFGVVFVILLTLSAFSTANGQQKETYTGTVLSYGSGLNTRTVTRAFSLDITGLTSDDEAQSYLNTLQENGQDDLLKAIDDNNLGRFSIGANVGVRINVVRESVADGKRRIFIVFARWMQFAELRGGYSSTDYPFGVIELFIDERTGKGDGTYIAAAKIRWDRDKQNKQNQIEIESFATFPAKLLGVTQRNRRRA